MDNKRLDALFSGLTRTNEAEDKQPIQQETSANAPSTPAKKPKAGNARAKQKKFDKALLKLKKDGTLSKLSKKYYNGEDVTKKSISND